MIFYNCLKLACHTVIQVFKILFYCLISFVLVFGCMFAFAHTHFSMLVHCRFFDCLWQLVKGLFINPNVSTIVSSIQSLGTSVADYGEILVQKGFGIEILLGIILLLCLFVIILWYRFAVNRDLYNVTTASSRGAHRDIWKQPTKSISQVLVSLLFTGLYDTISIVVLYYFCKFIITFQLNVYLAYFIFMLVALIFCTLRTILFNGWEYRQLVKDESAFKSMTHNIAQKSAHLWSAVYNSMFLVLCNWLILLAFGQILVGYLLVLAFAIVYHTSKCFGVSSYYYHTKETFYIYDRNSVRLDKENN